MQYFKSVSEQIQSSRTLLPTRSSPQIDSQRAADGLISTLRASPSNALINLAQLRRPRPRRPLEDSSKDTSSKDNATVDEAFHRDALNRIFLGQCPPTLLRSTGWGDLISRMVSELCRETTDPLYIWSKDPHPPRLLQCSAITPNMLISYIVAILTMPYAVARDHKEFFGLLGGEQRQLHISSDGLVHNQSQEVGQLDGFRRFIVVDIVNQGSLDSIGGRRVLGYNLDFFEWVWKLWMYNTGSVLSPVHDTQSVIFKKSEYFDNLFQTDQSVEGYISSFSSFPLNESRPPLIYEVHQYDAGIPDSTALRCMGDFLTVCHDAAAALIRKADSTGDHRRRCEFCASSDDGSRERHCTQIPIDNSTTFEHRVTGLATEGILSPTFLSDAQDMHHRNVIIDVVLSKGFEAQQYVSQIVPFDFLRRLALPRFPFRFQGLSCVRADIDALSDFCSKLDQFKSEFYGTCAESEKIDDIIANEILVDVLDTRRRRSVEWPDPVQISPVMDWFLRAKMAITTNGYGTSYREALIAGDQFMKGHRLWSKLLNPISTNLIQEYWEGYIDLTTTPVDIGPSDRVQFDIVHSYQEIKRTVVDARETNEGSISESLDLRPSLLINNSTTSSFLQPFPVVSLPAALLRWRVTVDKSVELNVHIPAEEDSFRLTKGIVCYPRDPCMCGIIKTDKDEQYVRVVPVMKLSIEDCPNLLPQIWRDLCKGWVKLSMEVQIDRPDDKKSALEIQKEPKEEDIKEEIKEKMKEKIKEKMKEEERFGLLLASFYSDVPSLNSTIRDNSELSSHHTEISPPPIISSPSIEVRRSEPTENVMLNERKGRQAVINKTRTVKKRRRISGGASTPEDEEAPKVDRIMQMSTGREPKDVKKIENIEQTNEDDIRISIGQPEESSNPTSPTRRSARLKQRREDCYDKRKL